MIDGKVAVAVVGCGGMGGGHAVAIATGSGQALWMTDGSKGRELLPGDTDLTTKMVLAGTYDIKEDRQEWARKQGFFTYNSFEDILADERVDVVLVATPNDDHKELSIRAMRAGKNVLCEKPVMMNSKDLEDVLEVAKETGKVFYPRQNRRWDKDYLTMKKVYDEKLIGNVFHIESRYHGSRGIPGDWRGIKEKGGGMMFDWGVHLLDRIVLMVPEKIKKVYAKMTHVTNDEVDDGFIMNMVFESGITATVEVGTCNFITLPHWYLCGDQGTAEIKDFRDPGRMVVLRSWEDKDATPILMGEGLSKTMAPRNADSVDDLPLPDIQYDRNQLYSNVCDVVLGKAEQIVKNEEALRVLRLMEAALESDEKGIAVNFE